MRKKDIFEENKELQSSLFLAQSYQDAWADYGRSLKKERFNSVCSVNAECGEDCYLEVSYVHPGSKIGNRVILSYK